MALYYIPINDTSFELSVFWPYDSESQINELRFSESISLSFKMRLTSVIVGHPEPEKKILLAFLSTFWHPCSKCILMCFKKDRGGCQVWKRPKVPELGQRSSECKFLCIRQILAFLSISYPKL